MARQDRAPLAGIRVVDSSDERGELCGRLLADLGADVVRVEPPGGAPSRRLPPFGPDGTSLRFAVRNTNKRSVTLDLDTDDQSRLDDLLSAADVWIAGRDRDGTGAAEAADRHPRLV